MKSEIKSLYRYFCNIIDTPAVILLYHRVTKLSSDPQQLAVDPENFHDHIKHLKQKYHLIDIVEFTEAISKKKRLPKNSVVLTFDDGYADNYYEALPILEHFMAQAIFYISTSLIDTPKEFWWDTLERIFLLNDSIPGLLSITVNNQNLMFNTADRVGKRQAYDKLHPIIKNCGSIERDQLVEYIVKWSGLSTIGRETHRLLTTRELQKLAQSKSAIIGAHTHAHPKLSVYSYKEQFDDILMCKQKLEELLNTKIEHFSYPFGSKSDYNQDSLKVVHDLEFKMVCSNYYNQVHRWHSRYELPRMLVRNWSLKDFRENTARFFKF